MKLACLLWYRFKNALLISTIFFLRHAKLTCQNTESDFFFKKKIKLKEEEKEDVGQKKGHLRMQEHQGQEAQVLGER